MFSLGSDYLTKTRNRRSRLQDQVSTNGKVRYVQGLDNNRRILLSSRFYISALITLTVIVVQLLLFHHYIGLRGKGSFGLNKLAREREDDIAYLIWKWNCRFPGLGHINHLAQKFGVDLVVVDPDLLWALDHNIGKNEQEIVFSSPTKRSQEPGKKSVVHLAAINETSGGQPNLKLFYNALKNNDYITLKYNDNSKLMQPEVYRRAPHLFDDSPLEAMLGHKYSHDSNTLHTSTHGDATDISYDGDQHEEVSKIYTEFISHIFILNRTYEDGQKKEPSYSTCDTKAYTQSKNLSFVVIHIFVLYNYDYDPLKKWIQSSLMMDELDKHKLLSYNVHSFDFVIPLEHYYIHPKRQITELIRLGNRVSPPSRIQLFEPKGEGVLNYVNNSYVHCATAQFNISGQIDDPRRLSKYLRLLDKSRPIRISLAYEFIQQQLLTAFRFMDTYSEAYGNFSYWITGSTLLSYLRFCTLASIPELDMADIQGGSQEEIETSLIENIVINLEFGVFANEVTGSVLNDLAKANVIGVSMMSDWQKPNGLVTFQLRDCPNFLFNLYLHELRKDFYQYYFISQNSMIMNHKFNKKSRAANQFGGHHVFNTNNLDLCWTRVDNSHPFRVPCNIYDHLRRIYIV